MIQNEHGILGALLRQGCLYPVNYKFAASLPLAFEKAGTIFPGVSSYYVWKKTSTKKMVLMKK